jgi:hypothetical protein
MFLGCHCCLLCGLPSGLRSVHGQVSCPSTLVQGLSLELEYLPNRDYTVTKHPILSKFQHAGHISGSRKREGVCD